MKSILFFISVIAVAFLSGCSSSSVTRENLSFPVSATLSTGSENARVLFNGQVFDLRISHASGSVTPKEIFDIQKQKILTQIDQVNRIGETEITNPCGGTTLFGEWAVNGKTFYGSVIGEPGATYGVFSHDVSKSAYQEFLGLITCK